MDFSGHPELKRAEYGYDLAGRRTHKILTAHDGREERVTFLWCGLRLYGERTSRRPAQSVLYLYSEGSHEPLARAVQGEGQCRLHWYQTQLNGLPEALADGQGRTVWRGKYDEWGSLTRAESTEGEESAEQNLRFAGQYFDRETGLHYTTFRYYDPQTGHFTQRDPIGLAGGLNLYQYAPNPLSWIDPCGEIVKAKSRNDALRQAKQHAQVPRISRGGENIGLDDLNPSSRGVNWGKMKAEGGQSLGRRNPNGKNQWFEHPDGHPDAGQPGIPEHHSGGHIHAIDPKGNEVIFTW